MIDISTSAPGKIVIAGEYAVLDGAPAICMAVNRRAHVSITSSDNEYHSVLAPGYSQSVGRFTAANDQIKWIEGAKEFELLDAVWQEVRPELADALTIVLDSNEFIDTASATKIGIGSSAALTTALTSALGLAAMQNVDVHKMAAAAHRRFQGGRGSGVDIACSVTGGVVEYRMGDRAIQSLNWPAELHYALFWSGIAASTREKLDRLAVADASSSRGELCRIANGVAEAWSNSGSVEILGRLREFVSVLRRFDVDHELGIFDAGHAALADAAESFGVVYKPCGAGGGDIGIAIAADEADIEIFAREASKHNFTRLSLAIDTAGQLRDGEQL